MLMLFFSLCICWLSVDWVMNRCLVVWLKLLDLMILMK